MTLTFIRAYPPAQPAPGPAYWLPLRDDKVLVRTTDAGYTLIAGDDEIRAQLQPVAVLYQGTLHGQACLTCEVAPEFVLPADWQEMTMRGLFGRIDEQFLMLVGYAAQLIEWQHSSRYCPRSGDLTEAMPGTWGRVCPRCGYSRYPPVTPAILVLVHDGERMLLTHKPGWGRRYSCIAGFVEPGELLEGCVQREIYEEVGLEVTDIAYIGSQSWPFPRQLMVGYTARYLRGEVRVDQQELDDARWFTADTLPELPPPQSLARRIITTWIETHR
jgi:NAD+ diphosphatase